MRVQMFVGKVSMESLQQMEEHMNDWLIQHKVEPKFVKQSFGYERSHQANQQEPMMIITVWY